MTRERTTAKRGGRPSKYSIGVRNKILSLIGRGYTVDDAARESGVHPATLYRWTNKYPAFEVDVRGAILRRDRLKYYLLGRGLPRPRVRWDRECPECGFEIEVRTAGGIGGFKFYRCSRWPRCAFASWRPRTPWDCPLCGEATFWSHSRKSFACESYWCRFRQTYIPS